MALVICDYLINMTYLIFHWFQRLYVLVVMVFVHFEQEVSHSSLVTSVYPTWDPDRFF
jgi:hypothetical protein